MDRQLDATDDSVSAAKDLGAVRWVRDSNGGAPERKDFFRMSPSQIRSYPTGSNRVAWAGAPRSGTAPRPEFIPFLLSANKPKMLAAAANLL